ncbi:HDOD domain-containing protein [Candidatus Symbiobacter mobilis]|uniref:Signal transduction protein n=1 Tax=Candidatus Symbiobacter mobilis CR TaxID=946483 RepID=U5N4H2_9BURK|nr:HDOD domain-containing protein [Candidatus Symbiobacter mobilis]AGX86356.1 signal transduction protein [Candidatus Symbiobacter mobilis CR]
MLSLPADLALKLTAAVDAMPAFPRSVQKILELTRDVNCTPKHLVQVIEQDPVVTVKILKAVNSAYFALTKKITSIDHAVVYLGFNTIKNLALSIAAIGMLPTRNAADFDSAQYLLHSLSTASIARRLAQNVDRADATDCFIAGLLHDFGKVVFAQFMPREFKQALQECQADGSSLHLALQRTIGVDHTVVGAMLAEKWRFAPELVDAIASQYDPSEHCTPTMACVFAANQVSKKMEFGFAGNPYVHPLTEAVGSFLGAKTLDDVIASLPDLDALFAEVKILASA